MRTLYFDCFAGASGNMILAALISAGLDTEALKRELGKLSIPEVEIELKNVDRSGINALHLNVVVPDESNHRHLSTIESLIENSDLSPYVKELSVRIFRRLGEAEAKIHGIEIEKVHFHEVGALDAIVDIVGVCIGFELLGIENFGCSRIHVGSGFVQMAHGKFPVPPPAVAELLRSAPIYSSETEGELITPTGAAIISTVCDSYGPIPEMSLEIAAYGAGTREYKDFPNVLRVLIGESREVAANAGQMVLLETNIDDSTPQIAGFVMERAFALGAVDCWFTPIQMKKDRPAIQLSVLCEADREADLLAMLYAETTTIGVRIQAVERDALERSVITVRTELGDVRVKIAERNGVIVNRMPEYEDVRKIAVETGRPMREVSEIVMAKLNETARTAAV